MKPRYQYTLVLTLHEDHGPVYAIPLVEQVGCRTFKTPGRRQRLQINQEQALGLQQITTFENSAGNLM